MEDGSTIRWVVWIGGCCLWIFGLCDRSLAALLDGRISAIDVVLLGTASVVAFGWVILIPMPFSKLVDLHDRWAHRMGIFL